MKAKCSGKYTDPVEDDVNEKWIVLYNKGF